MNFLIKEKKENFLEVVELVFMKEVLTETQDIVPILHQVLQQRLTLLFMNQEVIVVIRSFY
jgi:hypothetical protein